MTTQNHLLNVPHFRYLFSLTLFIFFIGSTFAQKHKEIDQMPYLISSECADKGPSEIKACSDKALLNFVYTNVKYPEAAKKKKVEGKAVINFTVNNKGMIQDVKILKDIGSGCGAEAARVVGLMNEKNMKWVPGKKDGKTVAVEFNLPVLFKCQ